jgi:DUF4097 and DUF4098 domain-containing protein YvlB
MRTKTILVILALLTATSSWAQVKVDESRPLAADGSVSISNIAGSVRVIGWGGSTVEITGVLGKDVEELEISGSENRLKIEVDVPSNADDIETDLEVKLPSTAEVDVSTVSASIEIEGMSGTVDAESVSGKVKVADQPSRLSVETVSGGITVGGASSRTDLASVSGNVEVAEVRGELEVETVSGNIKVQSGLLEGGSFESVSGSIYFDADMAHRGEFDFESMSGTVTVMVPPSVSADFDITTFSGSIHNDIGPEARRSSKYTAERELEFSTGGGGAEVSIESFSGSVKIKTR